MGFFIRLESAPAESPEERARRLKLRIEGFLHAGGDPRKFLDETSRTDFLAHLTAALRKDGREFERVDPVLFQKLLEAAGVSEWYHRKRMDE